MKTLSFYEQVGIVIPGALFLFGLMLAIPEIKIIFTSDSISIGSFGIYVIISYALGQLIASIGNILESFYWLVRGGIPSTWVVGKKPRLLSLVQIRQVQTKASEKLSIHLNLENISKKEWKSIFWQIFCEIEKSGRADRVDTFNGLYGLNRGLWTSTLILTTLAIYSQFNLYIVGFLLASAFFFMLRMERFAKHYAKEVFVQFLALKD